MLTDSFILRRRKEQYSGDSGSEMTSSPPPADQNRFSSRHDSEYGGAKALIITETTIIKEQIAQNSCLNDSDS